MFLKMKGFCLNFLLQSQPIQNIMFFKKTFSYSSLFYRSDYSANASLNQNVKWVKLIKTFLEYLTFHLYNCFLVPLSLYSGLWERIVLFSTPCNHQNKRAMAPWTEIIHLNKSNHTSCNGLFYKRILFYAGIGFQK